VADPVIEVSDVLPLPTAEIGRPHRRPGRWAWLLVAATAGLGILLAAVLIGGRGTRPERGTPNPTRVRDSGPPAPDSTSPPADASAPSLDMARGDVARGVTPARRTHPTPRPGHGTLDLNASPWARVYIDGTYAGETPLQGIRLRSGRHVVRLVNPTQKLSVTLTVQIRAGQTTRRWVRLGAPSHR